MCDYKLAFKNGNGVPLYYKVSESPNGLKGTDEQKAELKPWPKFDQDLWENGDPPCGKCGHPYHRHFDSYEDWAPVGCKYCDCFGWIPE